MPCTHHKVHLLSWKVDVLLGVPSPLVILCVLLRVAWTFLSLTHMKGTLIGVHTYGKNRWRQMQFGFLNPSVKRLLLLDMPSYGDRDQDAWFRTYSKLASDPWEDLQDLDALSKEYAVNLREAFRYEAAQQYATAAVPVIGWADRTLSVRNRLRVRLSRNAEKLLFATYRDSTPTMLRDFLRTLAQEAHGTHAQYVPHHDGWDLVWGWIDYDALVAHVGAGHTEPSVYLESCIPADGIAQVRAKVQEVEQGGQAA